MNLMVCRFSFKSISHKALLCNDCIEVHLQGLPRSQALDEIRKQLLFLQNEYREKLIFFNKMSKDPRNQYSFGNFDEVKPGKMYFLCCN